MEGIECHHPPLEFEGSRAQSTMTGINLALMLVWQLAVSQDDAEAKGDLNIELHTDLDPGSSKIKYILSGDGAGTIFVINDKTGDIHAMKRLDREEKAEYTLTAQAIDRDTNKPLEPPSEFIIKVQDINDNAPEFLDGPYHATVPEMSLVGCRKI
ncbi:hypothetical protein lerEdw1_000897 [Lerista edwardsae]|nr:hypothetical protein lerEdw1_000897 [Lerista edwardsae]